MRSSFLQGATIPPNSFVVCCAVSVNAFKCEQRKRSAISRQLSAEKRAVGIECHVHTDNREAIHQSLGDHEPVKGVFVVWRERGLPFCVLDRDWQDSQLQARSL